MSELLQAIIDLRTALATKDDPKQIRIAAATLLIAAGNLWLDLERPTPIGEDQALTADSVAECCGAIEELGGEVPAGAGGMFLKTLLPILLKLLLEALARDNS